jgi:hypothetical protein
MKMRTSPALLSLSLLAAPAGAHTLPSEVALAAQFAHQVFGLHHAVPLVLLIAAGAATVRALRRGSQRLRRKGRKSAVNR